MTNANSSTYLEARAERFGQAVPDSDGRRARLVATLHAVIAWLLANPGLPVPTSVTLGADAADLDALRAIATEFGTYVYPPEQPVQVTLYPVGEQPGEMYVSFHIRAAKKDRPL